MVGAGKIHVLGKKYQLTGYIFDGILEYIHVPV